MWRAWMVASVVVVASGCERSAGTTPRDFTLHVTYRGGIGGQRDLEFQLAGDTLTFRDHKNRGTITCSPAQLDELYADARRLPPPETRAESDVPMDGYELEITFVAAGSLFHLDGSRSDTPEDGVLFERLLDLTGTAL